MTERWDGVSDFYEDDEDPAQVREIAARAPDGVTWPPPGVSADNRAGLPRAVTADELRERRTALLADVRMTLEEFRARIASNYTLTGQEAEVRQELSNIAFLLNEEPID